MKIEDDATILIRIDPRIPRREVDAIGARLTASGERCHGQARRQGRFRTSG